ncbi:MAG: DUF296 domain-containing protein [Candidatus Diapherotrites archaeon]|uniref:DUF296 domain-containing protein n=1 Tax=Candidatus Iainarchaeum sp. TaxID=3101447 RepID=A0A8T3YQ86_9ARCH|nr:DUF296 domain-containing protein [Candidatus Diapherotrites archaeon]
MPRVDAQIFRKRGVRKLITLELDEGDAVLSCIKQAMEEHKVKEVSIEEADGMFKDGVVNFFERSSYKTADLAGRRIMRVSGNFKLSYGDLFGAFKVATFDKPPIQGTLVKGHAKAGFRIALSFVELQDEK